MPPYLDSRQDVEPLNPPVPKLCGWSTAHWCLRSPPSGRRGASSISVAKARAHADMVPAIQAYWHKSAWTIAMALRNSTSFGEAVKSVMNDVATWQEIIIANTAPPRRPPQLPPADPNASTEEYDDQGAGTWGGGNRRKRRRPGKPQGKGRDGKDQDPPKKTDAANQQDQGWWSTRGGGKQQNQQAWWGHAGGDQRHQNTDGGDRPWKRTGAGKGGGRR